MEQQKILWIILSVAVLLLAVLGTALFVFGPSSSNNEPATIVTDTTSEINKFDPIEWARTGSEYPSFNDITPQDNNEDGFVVFDNTTISAGKDGIPLSDLKIENKDSGTAVVSLPVKKVEQPKTVTTPAVQPKVAKSEPEAKAPVKTAASSEKKTTTPPVKTVANVKEYWIQTNSFSTIARAEEEKKAITAKGFPAVIQTKVDGDKTFYRVRVGSYTTKAEAEKFLYWIKDIKGFEGSQIYEVMAKREL